MADAESRSRRPCRGMIFDLDGTLADTLRDIAAAVNHGLSQFGLPRAEESWVRQWIGDGLPRLCERAMGGRCPDRLDEMVHVVAVRYRAHDLDHSALYPGMPELLDALVAAGVKLACLSNKPHAATARMVGTLCDRWPLVAVEGYRTEDRRKPDPRTAIQIVAAMNAEPPEVWLVGDSAADMETAHNAGLFAVAVTWGYRDRDQLLAANPDLMVDSTAELLETWVTSARVSGMGE